MKNTFLVLAAVLALAAGCSSWQENREESGGYQVGGNEPAGASLQTTNEFDAAPEALPPIQETPPGVTPQ
jgi:hypothetical protein